MDHQNKRSNEERFRYDGRQYKTDRVSKSYTDLSSQISGNNSRRKTSSTSHFRAMKRNVSSANKIDYEFLRNLLGIGGGKRMGERKRTTGERFLNDELKEAVMKVRKEVKHLKLEIKDKNWLKTLEDLGDIREMNEDLLEAVYMLRNAYKRGIFSSAISVKEDEEFPEGSKDKQMNQMFLSSPDFGLTSSLSHNNRCSSPLSTASHVSSDWSSDVESTTSSVMIKRRPAKPRIHLSSASLTELMNSREDDVVFVPQWNELFKSERQYHRAVSNDIDTSVNEPVDARPGSTESDTSYLNLGDDVTSKPVNDNRDNDGPRKTSYATFSTSAEPTRNDDTRIYKEFRSNSPTASLLRPLFQHKMSAELYDAICEVRAELSPKLRQLRNLEKDMQLMPVLQVKLAVLQEEKRQLMNIVKQKRGSTKQSLSSSYQSSNGSSPMHSRGSSPTSFISEGDEVIMIRPSPRRAMVSKETQTGLGDGVGAEAIVNKEICPYCLNEVANNNNDDDENLVAMTVQGLENAVANGPSALLVEEKIDVPVGVALLETAPTDKTSIRTEEVGVQSEVERADAATVTMKSELTNTAIGDECVYLDVQSVSTETIVVNNCVDKGVNVIPPVKLLADVAVQNSVENVDNGCQMDGAVHAEKTTMFGCALHDFHSIGLQSSAATSDASFGDDIAVRLYRDSEAQSLPVPVVDKETQSTKAVASDQGTMIGCGLGNFESTACQTVPVLRADFQCGDDKAVVETTSFATQSSVDVRDAVTNPMEIERRNFSSICDLDKKLSVTAGFGEDRVNDLLCDACANRRLVSVAVGSYSHGDTTMHVDELLQGDWLCKTDDKLCSCVRPQLSDMATGDDSIDNVICDICDNRTSRSIGCSEDRIDNALPCDKCDYLRTISIGCGDADVNELPCQQCAFRGEMVDKEIGHGDVFNEFCEKCRPSNQNEADSDVDERLLKNDESDICSEVYKIMAQSEVSSEVKYYPAMCNYCGNKVDVNDPSLDDKLATMRENFSAYKMEKLEATRRMESLAGFEKLDEDMDNYEESEHEEEDENEDDACDGYEESTSNDIVESCKMLQNHFSGEKPLKQQLMMKYLANIEKLWFQTVKKKRANAAVVKSYIDLFQSRIPELVDTIINLMDDDGNTSLHFALTYKNTGVVSILLDSNVCQIDMVNKAGYSPVMLAALAGFDSKTDKYVMQRLLRLGNVNCKNRETGQTPLMLAVSRSNLGMVDLILDAGADVNETDNVRIVNPDQYCDEVVFDRSISQSLRVGFSKIQIKDGSTALMCACENGSMTIVKALLSNPDCDSTIEDHEGSTALTIAMDSKRRDLALLIYGSLNFDARGRIKLTASKQSLLGLGTRRSPSPVVGRT
eukprot:gene7800-8646_t